MARLAAVAAGRRPVSSGGGREWLAAGRQWADWDPNAETRAEVQALCAAGDQAALGRLLGGRLGFGTAGLRAAMGAGASRTMRARAHTHIRRLPASGCLPAGQLQHGAVLGMRPRPLPSVGCPTIVHYAACGAYSWRGRR
jgi:hypothetical protein